MIRLISLLFSITSFIFILCAGNTSASDNNGAIYYDLGVYAYESGDYKSAEKNFGQVLETDPENPIYQHFLGKTFLKTKRYKDAISLFEKAFETAPEIAGLKYDMAFALFKTENYQKSAKFFIEMAAENTDDGLVNYHAGAALFKLKQYSKAPEYLSRAAEKSPTLRPQCNYITARCYQEEGRNKEAAEMFSKVEADPEASKLAERARKRKKNLRFYSLYAKIGIRYDDNVQLDPIDRDIYEDQSDTVTVFNFSGSYDLIRKKSYTFGAGYLHNQTIHSDFNEYDLIGSTVKAYAKYRRNPYQFGFSVLPSYYWVDSKKYERRFGLKPEFQWLIKKGLTSGMYYQYTDIHNYDTDERSGNTSEIALNIRKKLLENMVSLTGGIGGKIYNAAAEDESYFQWKIKTGLSFKLPMEFAAALNGEFQNRRYDIEQDCDCEKQHDYKWSANLSVSRPVFYDWLRMTGEYGFTKRTSTYKDKQYERNKFTISVSANY